jgi:DNA-3-methyladenine glycosylase
MKKNNSQVMLPREFFARDTLTVAKDLLGKVIFVKHKDLWLSAQITETEAYYLDDKASHASLGFTEKRKALFMPAGTIYMYYARGGPSFNVSTKGKGNAVLIKSARVYSDDLQVLTTMQQLNPLPGPRERPLEKLCAGQTLLCKALGLTVPDWDAKQFSLESFYLKDIGQQPTEIIQTTRKGIPKGRDEHLPYRCMAFFDQQSQIKIP